MKVGAHRLSDPNIKLLDISEIVVHKSYDLNRHYFDIALIRVKNKIEFLPTVGPICLPRAAEFREKPLVGHKSKLVGWGATRFGGPPTDRLREVDVDIIENKVCNKSYAQLLGHESAFPEGINRLLLCAGVAKGGKDSCQGDSGGPLAVAKDNKWYALGVVSFGYKCAEPDYPGMDPNPMNLLNILNILNTLNHADLNHFQFVQYAYHGDFICRHLHQSD